MGIGIGHLEEVICEHFAKDEDDTPGGGTKASVKIYLYKIDPVARYGQVPNVS